MFSWQCVSVDANELILVGSFAESSNCPGEVLSLMHCCL